MLQRESPIEGARRMACSARWRGRVPLRRSNESLSAPKKPPVDSEKHFNINKSALRHIRDKSFYQAKKSLSRFKSLDSKRYPSRFQRLTVLRHQTSWQSRRATVRVQARSTVTHIQPTGSKKRNCGINNAKIRRETTLLILSRLRPSRASVSQIFKAKV